MPHLLILGDRSYSSWSLRAWLIAERFGLPVETRFIDFDADDVPAQIGLHPARTVPALRLEDGTVMWDSLAIAEELASRHPQAGLWPADPAARAVARSLAAEMHAGFAPLRSWCPMNLRTAYAGCNPPPEVLADVARIETLWSHARRTCGGDGPWLCGAFSVADAFFAPVAMRIAGYSLPVGAEAAAYVAAHLADPAFVRWRRAGLAEGATLARYARSWPEKPWPGP